MTDVCCCGWKQEVASLRNVAASAAAAPRKKSNNMAPTQIIQVVVSNIFYFHPYLGKIPILTTIFQMGWFNHQPENPFYTASFYMVRMFIF